MGIPTDHTMGHVGVPIPSLAVKLGPVPALGYDGVAGGEIMVKGNSVTPGYFKRDEITKETFDSSGFLKTGDIGRWNIDGNLVILDRTSNIFKLSQGEFVSPEKIEQIYNRSRYVAQCYVHGNPLKSCIVAVIVVDEEAICKLGQQLNILQSVEHLCEEEAIRRAVIADLAKIGREHGLLGYEIAKEIKLTTTHFTVENGQLTPSLKNRRQAICRDYKEDLDELYKHLR
ncbi:hypothetical protein WR25_00610 [Diploscapter pachys]|uniref:AMP-dependent synthetase/ligase domain-containing protein n=1 Tax=Diploscapter pachys TaxID=2018661 RepID=A0A2A2KI91_9BILA|nr:hypothetical protein WR25_00610 [Diploscapter pachys]